MRIYWSELSIPELAELPRPLARKIYRLSEYRWRRRSLFSWQFLLGVFISIVLGLAGGYIGTLTGLRIGLVAGTFFGIVLGIFITAQLQLRGMRPFVREDLAKYHSIKWFPYPKSFREMKGDSSYRWKMLSENTQIAYHVKELSREEFEKYPFPEDVEDCVLKGQDNVYIYIALQNGRIVEPDPADLINLDFRLFPRE